MCVYGVPYSTVVVAGPNESFKIQRERKSSCILDLKCALPVSKISKDLPLNAIRDSPVNFLENELSTNLSCP